MTPLTGEIIDGYRFLGGDPGDEKSWEKFDNVPRRGDILDGFRFIGGDPGSQDSWRPKNEPFKSALAEEAPAFDYAPVAAPEEQMAAAQPEVGLAEARRPSVTEALPAGAPVSERPLRMPERRETEEDRRLRLLGLGAMAERVIAEPAPAPTRPGPTIEAAKQLEQQRIIESARENLGDILAAQAEAQDLFGKYKNYREVFAAEYPLTSAAMSGAAGMVSGTANIPSFAADAFNQTFINPVLSATGLPQIPRVSTAFGTEFLAKAASDYMPAVGKQGMEEAYKKGEFGAWLASKVAANSPQMAQQLAAIFVPPLRPLLLGTMSATAAGQSFAEGDDPRVAAAKGVVEYVTEKIPLGVFDKVNDVLRGMSPAKQNVVLAVVGQRLLQSGAAVTINGLTNTIEETAAQFGGNVLDKYFQGKDIALTKDLGEAAVIGAVTGKIISAPQVAAVATGRYEPASILARSLEGMQFPAANIPPAGGAAAEQARAAALQAWETQGLTPATRTMEQVRRDVEAAPDLDSAISTAEQAVAEIQPARQAARAEQIPLAAPAIEAAPEAPVSAMSDLERRRAIVEGTLLAEPTAPPVTEAAPAVTAPPVAPAITEAPTAPAETPEAAKQVILQNRNRATPASIAQMASIAAKPDYGRLGFSRDFANGAPVVFGGEIPAEQVGREDVAIAQDGRRIPVRYAVVDANNLLASNKADGTPNADYGDTNVRAIRAVAGNGRIAGLQAAYEGKTTGPYRKELADDELHGVSKEVIRKMKRPVLVRVMPDAMVTPDIGDVSNVSAGLALSTVEKAKNDANRVDLAGLEFAPDGGVTNKTLIQFVRAMPQSEQGDLIDTNGSPTIAAVDRLNAAIFRKAYQNDELVRLYAQSKDPEARLVLSALAQIAPKMARLEGAGDLDIRAAVTQAAEAVVNARRTGLTLDEAARQVDLTVSDPSVQEILKLFARNSRRVKPIVQALNTAADLAYAESNKPAEDMFGAVEKRTRQDILSDLENYESAQLELREDGARIAPRNVQEGEARAIAAAEKAIQKGIADKQKFSDAPIPTKRTDSPAKILGGVKLVAGGLNRQLQEQGNSLLVGQVVNSVADLAEAAQIYRGPFEVFRAFFVDEKGVIIHQTGVSSRLPSQSGIVPGDFLEGNKAAYKWFGEMVKKTGAKGFYVLHNHPSGDPSPSKPDITTTIDIAKNKSFLGHVIIDTNDFVEIRKTGTPYRYKLKETREDKLRNYIIKNGVIGATIFNSNEVAKIGKKFASDKNVSIVIAYGTRIEAIGEIPNEVLMHPARGPAAIRRFARFNAGGDIFIYTTNEIKKSEQMFSLYQRGFVTDVSSADGDSIVRAAGGTSPKRRDFGETKTTAVRQPIRVGREGLIESLADGNLVSATELIANPDIYDVYQGVRGLIQRAPTIKSRYDRRMERLADREGMDLLAGPIKTLPRAFSKVWFDYGGDYKKIGDIVRSTLVVEDLRDLPEMIRALVDYFPGVSVKRNSWDLNAVVPRSGYRDVFFKGAQISGFPVELQMNFAEMLKAKDKAHVLYGKEEQLRRMLASKENPPSPGEVSSINDQIEGLVIRQLEIYSEASEAVFDRANISRQSDSGIWTPSDAQVERPNVRGAVSPVLVLSSQAERIPRTSQVTGTPLTSKKVVPSGKESGIIPVSPEITAKETVAQSRGQPQDITRRGQYAIQEPSAEALPVLPRARGGEAVGERDAQRQEAAREGRAGEAGAEKVAAWAKKTFGDSIAPNGNPVWENFVKWFGNSSVVNKSGDPILVYHGTAGNFSTFDLFANSKGAKAEEGGFFFAVSPKLADMFARAAQGVGGSGANVMPVYLSIKNPKILKREDVMRVVDDRWSHDPKMMREQIAIAKQEGYDGLLLKNYLEDLTVDNETYINGEDQWVAFDSAQVKSSSGNNGNFEIEEPSIVKSQLLPYEGNPASVDAPGPSRIDDIIRAIQDKNIDLKRVIDRVAASGTRIEDAFDPYLQEGLAVSRMAAADEDFKNNELVPLLERLGMANVTLQELEEYLHARHAPSRNREMAKRNPTKEELDSIRRDIDDAIKNSTPGSRDQDQLYKEKREWAMVKPWSGTEEERQSLSGMSTADAERYLAELDPDKKSKLERMAYRVDEMIAKTRNMLIQGGVDAADSFNDSWEYYVPLHREGKEDGGFGYGQGYSIKGKSTRTATGSTRKVVNIIANIAAAREQAITRVEKNRVANAMIGFAMLNPDPRLWTVDEAPKTAVLDKATGKVVMRPDPNYKNDDNVIVARMPDGKGGIIEHAVVFNPENETAMRIVAAMKGLDTNELGRVLTINAKVTRFIASMNTQYNPIFGIVNLVRDLQSSAINIQDTAIAGKQAQLISEATKALGAIFLELRAQRQGEKRDSEYSRLFEEFKKEGGQTGFRDAWTLNSDKTKQMETLVNRMMATGASRVAYDALGAVKSVTADLLSDYNTTLENAIRVAAYKIAKEQGLSKARAAMLAKDVTVNFNRKGNLSNQIGAGYAFFNAAVQGTERLGRVLDIKISPSGKVTMGPRGVKIVSGGVLIGVAQAMALAAAGIDDDEIPDFIKEKNLIIPLGLIPNVGMFSEETRKRGYITIPMPLGLHVLPNLGRLSTELVLNGFKDPGKKALKMLTVTADAFNPLGTAVGLQTLSPTTLDPVVALLENKDWTGKPIYRQSFDQLGSVPGFERAKDNPSFIGMAIAKGLNKLSGGTEFSSGAISPTPEAIEYLIGQATGGPGRELTKLQKLASALASGDEVPPSNIPLVSRFYGEIRGQTSQGQKFYENVGEMLRHGREINGIKSRREDLGQAEVKAMVDEYIYKNPIAEDWEKAREAMRDVQKMNKSKREAIKNEATKEEVKEINDKITERMAKFNQFVKDKRAEEE